MFVFVGVLVHTQVDNEQRVVIYAPNVRLILPWHCELLYKIAPIIDSALHEISPHEGVKHKIDSPQQLLQVVFVILLGLSLVEVEGLAQGVLDL